MQFAAIPVPLSEEDGYHIHPDKIAEEIARGTSVILTSNPRNPTGRVVANPELAEIQDICRGRATFISDEFYSGYNYTSDCDGIEPDDLRKCSRPATSTHPRRRTHDAQYRISCPDRSHTSFAFSNQ